MNKQIRLSIKKVLKYFSIFGYRPTLDELYTFLPMKIDKNKLKYTPVEYSMRRKISKKKLENWKFKLFITLVSLFPQIRLIGLSGSISMMNAKEDDDIDLFIITAKNRLFTGRLIALVLAQILGLRRSRERGGTGVYFGISRENKDKVCLNLFFDERDLKIPKFKQTLFVGHEVLQMKPIVVKDNIYQRFLGENRWVFRLFPNGKSKYQILNIKSQINYKRFKFKILNLFGTCNLRFKIFDKIESLFKGFQMKSINKHRTTELITKTQLWFHPDDFEKKIKRTILVDI